MKTPVISKETPYAAQEKNSSVLLLRLFSSSNTFPSRQLLLNALMNNLSSFPKDIKNKTRRYWLL